jgi:aldose 1-epimerase
MKNVNTLIGLLWIVLLSGCFIKTEKSMNKEMSSQLQSWDFSNANGMVMTVTNLGGRIVSLTVPNKGGQSVDVVLGYDSLTQYLTDNSYLGALIGRYGNRIGKGKFTLDGQEYTLATNNGKNALHGGPGGFHNVIWQGEPFQSGDNDALELTYLSADGEEGYPGNLKVKVTYTLTDQNEVVIDYEATTDKSTVLNLTHHSYFNLAGAGNGDILNHQFEIFADKFTPVDEGLIPTGELKSVAGTSFDFTTPHTAGERINNDEEQLRFGKGYDHNFVLTRTKPDTLSLAARVTEPNSGLVMEVYTTEPGIQFYSGNFLDGTTIGKGGKAYTHRSAFCLETQHFPDSPNKQDFPSTVVKPGETYKQRTVYKFMVK